MAVKKYKCGKQINSIDEMLGKEFIYVVHDNKEQIYNAGWFKSWQLMYVNNLIAKGCIYEAISNSEIEESKFKNELIKGLNPNSSSLDDVIARLNDVIKLINNYMK